MTTTTITSATDLLAAELRNLLGDDAVASDLETRRRASIDDATMSPVLKPLIPENPADLVVYPADAEQIAIAVAAAYRHNIAITPRGKGTGNYGQAIPLQQGIVIDTSRANTILSIDEHTITAEAGARMIALEQLAQKHDKQLWMYPSTVQSTIGGFLGGGSGGTGSLAHGANNEGFVVGLDIVLPGPEAVITHIDAEDVEPYIHAYGTTGIIVRATVRIEPLQDWVCVYASYEHFDGGVTEAIRQIGSMNPVPRLASADVAELAAHFPNDSAIPAGRASLRAIVDADGLEAIRTIIANTGGTVEAERRGMQESVKLAQMSYNHPSWWLIRSEPGAWFHLEVGGDALLEKVPAIQQVYTGTLMHLEASPHGPHGMLNGRFSDALNVFDGFEKLTELGVGYHSPHHWYMDRNMAAVRELAAEVDPTGLLNPGKLVETIPVPH